MRAASEAALQRSGDAVARGYRAVCSRAFALASLPPPFVLAPLVALQLAGVLLVTRRVDHDGWVFGNAGAAAFWHAGSGDALAAVVLVQALVLLPLTTVCVHALARRIAGPLFAAFAAALWVVAPLLTLRLERPDYRERFEQLFLPQALGLVDAEGFVSLVLLLGAAVFVFRALDAARASDAVVAGLLVGAAIAVQPVNALMLPVPAVALAIRRQRPGLLLYGAAVVPWLVAVIVARHGISWPDFSWSRFANANDGLREYFWSRLLLDYLPLAGAFAAIRKSTAKGVYLALWAAVYLVVRGGAPDVDVWSTAYFRAGLPGLPAYALLVAAVVLLVPGWGRQPPATSDARA